MEKQKIQTATVRELPIATKKVSLQLYQGIEKAMPELPGKRVEQLSDKWAVLIQQGQFEKMKAELSLLHHPKFFEKINPKSIAEIFRSNTPTLATIKKYQGDSVSQKSIELCLLAVNEFYGVKSGLSNEQMPMISSLIYSEYHYLTLADLKYCIRQGLLGKYEDKVYGKVTPDVIMRWIRVHSEQRMVEAEAKSISDHQAKMKQQQLDFENGGFEDEYALEQIVKIRKALEEKWKANEEDKVWRVHYSSVEQYCKDHELNPVVLRDEWKDDYSDCDGEVDYADFMKWKESQFLFQVNNENQ